MSSFLKKTSSSEEKPDDRLERLSFVPNWVRNEIIAFVGEFCGTFTFLFMGFTAIQIAASATPANGNVPYTINLLFISSAFGSSLAVNVWVFFRISGGLFNPAVSIHIPHLTSRLLM